MDSLVKLDTPEHPEHLETQDSPVPRDLVVQREQVATVELPDQSDSRASRVTLGQLEPRVNLEQLEQPGRPVPLDSRASRARRGPLERRVTLDLPEHRARRE